MKKEYSTHIAMDRMKHLHYAFVLCCLCISTVYCKPLHVRHLLQDTPDHGDGPLTDLSHTANSRQSDHDDVTTGPDPTDQNLHNQPGDSASNGQGDLDTVHASDGHLVANLQGGDHDVHGHDLDTAGQSQGLDSFSDYGSIDHGSLTDGNDDNDAIPDGSVDTHDNTNPDSQLNNNANDFNNIQNSIDNHDSSIQDSQRVESSDKVLNQLHDIHNTIHHTDHSIVDNLQHSSIDHQSSTGLLDDTAQIDNGDSDDDYDAADDYVIPDSAAHTHQDAVDTHHDSAIASHSDSLTDHHDGAIRSQSDTLTDHHDSAIPSHAINPGHDSAPSHSDTLTNHDNALAAHHPKVLPHNDGMVLDSHSSGNDSVVAVSNTNSSSGNENSAPVYNGNSHVDHHSEGSGNAPDWHNNTADHHNGHQIDHNTGLLLDSVFGHLDQHGSLDGHGIHSDGHNSGSDGHFDTLGGHGAVIADPHSGLDHSAGVHVPDTDHIHEGSGSPPDIGTDHSTEHGHEHGSGSDGSGSPPDIGTDHGTEPGHEHGSGSHALPPSHSLPPSHEGHEVHPDTVPGSGDGPGIDKDGGVHDLSHHGDHEPEHVDPGRPRHTDILTTTTATPLASNTTVKVVILPSPVEPEIVDHSRTTPGPHSGEEIEGSGSEGLPVAIVTTRTTPIGEGHQGHIVAVTTTNSRHHVTEGSGSGQGQTEHEGHPDEHEGEGHLPGEGSGQEPEGHEGAVNTTAERSGKEHYKGDLKNSSSVLPSEAPCFIQPSSVLVIVPTSSSSAMESVTEPNRGHSSMNVHQLAQTPISVSMSLSPGNSQMVLQSSFSTDTFGLVSESPIFSHSSFSTLKLASLSMTESPVPHISTSLEYPQSRMPSESSIYSDSLTFNSISSVSAPSSLKVIDTSTLISEEFYLHKA